MNRKTKKQLKQGILYALVAVFIGGTFLLYLPLSQPAPSATAPPLNSLPDTQLNATPPPVVPGQ